MASLYSPFDSVNRLLINLYIILLNRVQQSTKYMILNIFIVISLQIYRVLQVLYRVYRFSHRLDCLPFISLLSVPFIAFISLISVFHQLSNYRLLSCRNLSGILQVSFRYTLVLLSSTSLAIESLILLSIESLQNIYLIILSFS